MTGVGTVLADRYRLERRIARGGMGDVFAAEDTRLERRVAVKVLRGGAAGDFERFQGEISTLARLSHPSIVRLHDAGEQDGTPFLVMELVEGRSLEEVIRTDAGDEEVARRVGIDLADALAFAHARGIIHRDVKPGNVLIDEAGRARLADFGIARIADVTGLTATGTTLGTAAYLAPEQLSGNDIGPAADVYSLGLVLLELLTGRRAFDGTTAETAFGRLSRDPEVPDDLAAGWRALLAAMTTREPGARPTPEQVGAQLRAGPRLDATQRLDLGTTATVRLDREGGPTTRIERQPTTTPLEDEPPTAAPSPGRRAEERPTAPARRGTRRLAPYAVLLILAVVAIAAVLATTLADEPTTGSPPAEEQQTTPAEEPQAEDGDEVPGEDGGLPPGLEDAVDRLEDAVSP